MAQKNLIGNELASEFRGKIEDNFTELYATSLGLLPEAYSGLATTTTTPIVVEGVTQWWLASGPGTYTNFGGLIITGNFAILSYSGTEWTKYEQTITAPNVVQTTGTSTTDIMSQKVVSDIFFQNTTFVDVQNASTDGQDKIDFNTCVKAFYSLTILEANERLVISYFTRVGTTNAFQVGLTKYNTSTQLSTEIAATIGLTYEFNKVVAIYDVSTKTNIVAYMYADLNSYVGPVYNLGQGFARMPYALSISFDYLKQPIISNYFVDNRLSTIETSMQNIDTEQPIITIWGDSITWGSASSSADTCYTAILRQLLLSNNYREGVINCGVGGENFHNILVRHGAFGLYVSEDVTIPANVTEKVAIQTTTNYINNRRLRNTYHGADSYFSLLTQGGEVGRDNQQDAYNTVNPLIVNNIELLMTYEGTQQDNILYLSSKTNQSNTTLIKAGTLLHPHGNTFKSKIEVFAIGTNDGFIVKNNNVIDLAASINKYIDMIEIARQKSNSYFIVCSPYGGTALTELSVSGLQSLEAALLRKYGTRFFNWREYLVNYGLLDAGITPTTADMTAISQGLVPPSLLSDGLHPNDAGHLVLGRKLFNILKSCGFITLKN